MAYFVLSVAAANFEDTLGQLGLVSQVNAALSTLLMNAIRGVSFLAEDQDVAAPAWEQGEQGQERRGQGSKHG